MSSRKQATTVIWLYGNITHARLGTPPEGGQDDGYATLVVRRERGITPFARRGSEMKLVDSQPAGRLYAEHSSFSP